MTDRMLYEQLRLVSEARGLLAKQFYAIRTESTGGIDAVFKELEKHVAYQEQLQEDGHLFGAGPLADAATGTEWHGEGLVIVRAPSLGHARALAEADPMHSSGARRYTIQPWLLNEGRMNLTLDLSTRSVSLD